MRSNKSWSNGIVTHINNDFITVQWNVDSNVTATKKVHFSNVRAAETLLKKKNILMIVFVFDSFFYLKKVVFIFYKLFSH